MSFIWTTYEGRQIPLKKIEDMHLANIIKWVEDRRHFYEEETLETLKEEAKERGLPDWFLERAPYPHKNIKGKWCFGLPKTQETQTASTRRNIVTNKLQQLQMMLAGRAALEKIKRVAIEKGITGAEAEAMMSKKIEEKLGDQKEFETIYDAAAAFHKIKKGELLASPMCKELVDHFQKHVIEATLDVIGETFGLTRDEGAALLFFYQKVSEEE
jgi:hypothetical protein